MKSAKWMAIVTLFVTMCFSSCSDNDKASSITIVADDAVYDDNNNTLFLSNSVEELFLQIKGGVGGYASTNNNETVLSMEFSRNVISLKPLALGQAIITITDTSENSFSLIVEVIEGGINALPANARCVIYGDNLSEVDKENLIEDIRSHSFFGGFRLIPNAGSTGKFRLYPKDYDGTEYEEYDCVINGELNEDLTPVFIDTQIYSWYVLTSGSEELCFYITRNWNPDNAIELRAIAPSVPVVIDVTSRHKAKYPELTRVYVIY